MSESEGEEGEVVVQGTCHAEMKGADWYTTSLTFSSSSSNILSSTCTCENERKGAAVTYCKHKGALLFSILALTLYSSSPSTPKLFRQKNMDVFDGADPKLQQQVLYGMTWEANFQRMVSPVPKKRAFSSSYNKVITDLNPAKKKRKIADHPLYDKKVVEL